MRRLTVGNRGQQAPIAEGSIVVTRLHLVKESVHMRTLMKSLTTT